MAALLELVNVERHFSVGRSLLGPKASVKAVDGVSFDIGEGETFGLIGESGCGKTTLAKLVLGLDRPGGGQIRYKGRDIAGLAGADWRDYRLGVQAVFQDPQSSLNPRMRVAELVGEPMIVGLRMDKAAVKRKVGEVLQQVGIDPSMANRFPHQFSGGQRQRIAIARALAANARLIVLDEPVASLDVSVRSQVLNLLKDLQERQGLSYLLISHDLATSAYLCHRLAVMYLGQVVETGTAEQIYGSPRHPYTKALLQAAEVDLDKVTQMAPPITDEVPNPIAPPEGCRFHPRCPQVMAQCKSAPPHLRGVGTAGTVACHLYP